MAIYCSVPNCKNGPGNVTEGIGFYKFPLADTVRLQQWLKNMNCDKWTPCHEDYICEEHFSASCFIVQWGVRYLCNEAVPTVFHKGQKRKATDYIEKIAKQPRVHVTESMVIDKRSDGGSLERSVEAYRKQVQDGLTGASSFPVEFLQKDTDQCNRGDSTEVTYQELASDSDEGEGDDADEREGDNTDEGQGGDTESDEDSTGYQDQQPEDHCCRNNKLSIDQLKMIIADLQQNVKVLQQREHQQLQTLAVLEKEVICLWQTEVLNEERLQTLETSRKQKATGYTEENPKGPRIDSNECVKAFDETSGAVDAVVRESTSQAVEVSERSLQPYLDQSGHEFTIASSFPEELHQTDRDPYNSGDNPEDHRPVGSESTLCSTDDTVASLCAQHVNSATEQFSTVHENTQVTVCFETVPCIFPSNSTRWHCCAETILTSALSSRPITSILPIQMSRHV